MAIDVNVDLAQVILYVLVALHLARANMAEKMDSITKTFADLPNDLREQFKKFALDTIERKVNETIDKMPDECGEAISNEKMQKYRTPLVAALKYLASLLERGFNIDVRVGKPPEETAAEGDADETINQLRERRQRFVALGRAASSLKVIQKQSIPILSLEDATGGEDENQE